MGDDKPRKLKAFLGQLPEKIVRQLTAAIERDQLSGGKELPHEMLLDGLRPSLSAAEQRVSRTPTPMRLFCLPFEDLLVAGRTEKRAGLIARSSLMPIWEWMASEIMPALFRDLYDRLTVAILENDGTNTRKIASELHAAGAAAIARAIEAAPPESERRKEIADILGGEDAVVDAEDMMRVLEAAPEVLDLREVFPVQAKTLDPELLGQLRSHYEMVAQHLPDSAKYLVVIAMRRLKKPWEILRAGASLSKRKDDSLLAKTDLGVIGDLLFGDMEDCVAFFVAQDSRSFDADDALYHLTKYARFADGVSCEFDLLKDGPWDIRLRDIKKRAAIALEELIEHVPAQIRNAMPFRTAGSYAARTSKRPDLRHDIDPDAHERATQLATFMRESRPIASAAAIAAAHADAYDSILENLNDYRNGLLSELRTFDDPEVLSRARAYLDLTVELTAILVSEGEAQIFRRKGSLAERNDQAAAG